MCYKHEDIILMTVVLKSTSNDARYGTCVAYKHPNEVIGSHHTRPTEGGDCWQQTLQECLASAPLQFYFHVAETFYEIWTGPGQPPFKHVLNHQAFYRSAWDNFIWISLKLVVSLIT